MRRLTLVAGQPVMPEDVIEANTLHYSALGIAGASLSLSGYAANSLHDTFLKEGALCTRPFPNQAAGSPTYELVTGNPIGGLVDNGGLIAAFSGSPVKNSAASARSQGVAPTNFSVAGSIGLALATPTAITRFTATGPTDGGILGNATPTPWQWRSSNVNNFDTADIIASGMTPNGVGAAMTVEMPNAPARLFHWFVAAGNGYNAIYMALLQPYKTIAPPPSLPRGIIDDVNGNPVNESFIVCESDSGQIQCDPGTAEYLGLVMIDPVSGRASHKPSYGLDRYSSVWNARNQVQHILRAGDPRDFVNGDKVYTPVAYGATQPPYQFGPVENNPLIRLRVLSGLHKHATRVTYGQSYFMSNVSAYWFGIGIDSTVTPAGWVSANHDNAGDFEGDGQIAECIIPPFVGIRTANAIEGQRYNTVAYWGEENMRLYASIWH